jgi:hypothetical protein
MTQTSKGATDPRIYEDFKLCGCSRHHLSSSPEPAADDHHLHNSPRPSGGADSLEYPRLAIDAVEHVLVYGSEDEVVLKDVHVKGKTPFFGSVGYLIDFSGRKLPGSQILAALPVDLAKLGDTFKWPPKQREPFGELPVDATNADVGFARNSFDFGDGNLIVTVGAAIPKILPLKGGGAVLWVTSCQLITQGTGKYEGARGIQSFAGTSYFPVWPASPEGQVGVLSTPFKARIHRCIRLVLKRNHVA